MKGLRWLIFAVVAGVLTGIGGYLTAATSHSATTQPTTSADEVSQAQEAMQKLLEQGPPITSPTLPGSGVVGKEESPASKVSKKKGRGEKPGSSIVPSSKSQIKHKLLPEGYYLADRRGRLTRLTDSWLFVFESDGKVMADPPMKVLPNRWLEKMESDVAGSHEAMIFRVSGEITTYHGENFLLLRKVLMEREPQDNFR